MTMTPEQAVIAQVAATLLAAQPDRSVSEVVGTAVAVVEAAKQQK